MLGEFTTFGDEEKSMAMHGTVIPGKEEWSSYAERLTHYFIANGVDDATKYAPSYSLTAEQLLTS